MMQILGLKQQLNMRPELTVFPELRHKLVSGLVEQRSNIIVQRVHVLHQPLICFVVHLKSNIRQELSKCIYVDSH